MERKATILIVDDDRLNRELLDAMLRPEGYSTQSAASGEEALAIVAQQQPDLILLDVMMGGMDGYRAARRLKENPASQNIPIIMVTSLNDRNAKLRGLEAGAEEFLSKPVDRAELWIRVRNLLRLKEYGDFLDGYNRLLQQKVEARTAQLRGSYIETVFTMTRAAEYKDEDAGDHVRRVSYYSRELALALGMDGVFADSIFYACPMHDIGKIGVPDRILLKPDALTPEESAIMESHCRLGVRILGKSQSPYLQMAAEIALGHHEHWDGTGYPDGLEREAIPVSARIAAICDVYDALRSKRPYKPACGHDETLDIITGGDGRSRPSHFDPAVLQAFRGNAEVFREIYETYQ